MPAEPTLHPPIASGNGHDPPSDATPSAGFAPPPRPPGPSARPAMVVIGIAAVVLLAGGIGAALTSSGGPANPKPAVLHTAPGATITAVADSGAAFRPVETAGQPPTDVLAAIVLPKGATVRTGSSTNNGIGLYDRSLSFQIGVTQGRVIDFFRAELKAFRWQIVSQGPASNDPGYRIVGQHPSSDGYEWEIGVTAEPSVFGATSQVTAFTIRLFIITDT